MSSLDRVAEPGELVDHEVVDNAVKITKDLFDRAEEAERLERLPDENIDALRNAGILRLTAPRTVGGRQASAETTLRVTEQLATGCGSTAFVTSLYAVAPYLIGRMSDECQAEVFAKDDSMVVNTFNPGGNAEPDGDGFRLSGKWPFCTGQHHADWAVMSAFVPTGDVFPDIGFCLVPRSEFTSSDDWQVTGLAGTGSATLTLPETFVPSHRVMLLSDLLGGNFSSTLANTNPYYRAPILPLPFAGLAGVALGLAQAAFDLLSERIGRRAITYTTYFRQADATVTHLQMAEVQMKIDEAAFHALRVAQIADRNDPDLDLEARARCRADCAWVLRRCKEATDMVQAASGASAIHRRDPLQRIIRDMNAYSVHSLLLFSTNAELYGRVLSGVDPGTPFV